MTHRSFAAAADEIEGKPITFDLGKGADFAVERPLPGLVLSELASLGDEDGKSQLASYYRFFEAVMEPEEFKRFREECNARRVKIETLTEIASYVVSEDVGRPLEERSTLPRQPSRNSRTSRAGVSTRR